MNVPYDRYYYLTSCGAPYERTDQWLSFFRNIAEHIIEDIGPETVLDAGCAKGFLVEALRDKGIEAYGIDISEYAIGEVREDIRDFCTIRSILQPLERHYDLIVTIELMEHLSPEDCRQAIKNLCHHTDDILFTSTPYDFKEATHLNVQPPEYWAEIFAHHGFIRDIDYDSSYIADHAMRFVRTKKKLPGIIRDYERKNFITSLENKKLRELSLEMKATLSGQHGEIEDLRNQVQVKGAHIAHLEGILGTQEQDIQVKGAHIAHLEGILGTQEQDIQEKGARIVHLEGILGTQEQDIQLKGAHIAHLEEEHKLLILQISSQKKEISDISQLILKREEEIKRISSSLETIRNSTTWLLVTKLQAFVDQTMPQGTRIRQFYTWSLFHIRTLVRMTIFEILNIGNKK